MLSTRSTFGTSYVKNLVTDILFCFHIPLLYLRWLTFFTLINLIFSDVSSNQIVFHIQQDGNKEYADGYLEQRITEQVEKIILHSLMLWYNFFSLFLCFYLVIRCMQKQPTTVLLLCFSSEKFYNKFYWKTPDCSFCSVNLYA